MTIHITGGHMTVGFLLNLCQSWLASGGSKADPVAAFADPEGNHLVVLDEGYDIALVHSERPWPSRGVYVTPGPRFPKGKTLLASIDDDRRMLVLPALEEVDWHPSAFEAFEVDAPSPTVP